MAQKFQIINKSLIVADTILMKDVVDESLGSIYYDIKQLEDNDIVILVFRGGAVAGQTELFVARLADTTDFAGTVFTRETFKAFARTNFGFVGEGTPIGSVGNLVKIVTAARTGMFTVNKGFTSLIAYISVNTNTGDMTIDGLTYKVDQFFSINWDKNDGNADIVFDLGTNVINTTEIR